MRGLKTIRSLRTVAAGHAFVQNLRRGHYEITFYVPIRDRVRVARPPPIAATTSTAGLQLSHPSISATAPPRATTWSTRWLDERSLAPPKASSPRID
jgi:hypothetical protein